jgi:hypothetical protein
MVVPDVLCTCGGLLFAFCAADISCGFVGVCQLFCHVSVVTSEFDAVQQYSWRQYHAKGKDVQYAALQVRIRMLFDLVDTTGGILHVVFRQGVAVCFCADTIVCGIGVFQLFGRKVVLDVPPAWLGGGTAVQLEAVPRKGQRCAVRCTTGLHLKPSD